jgi:hypothetical protein
MRNMTNLLLKYQHTQAHYFAYSRRDDLRKNASVQGTTLFNKIRQAGFNISTDHLVGFFLKTQQGQFS